MICQNCQTEVDDDLIFCTNCGKRLFETKSAAQTVLINDSVVRQTAVENPAQTVLMNDSDVRQPAAAHQRKSSSNFKWIALSLALIAIPASIFGVYLLTNSKQIAQNPNKLPPPTATRKANTNQNLTANNSNANFSNATTANANLNANTNSASPKIKTEIMNERIEIAPKEHYAVSFEIEKENTKLVGEAKLLEGEKITGFVYLQKSYDEYFPDPTYKMFSFEGRKTAEINAPLVEEEYVLIFVNDTDNPMIIQGNFSVE